MSTILGEVQLALDESLHLEPSIYAQLIGIIILN